MQSRSWRAIQPLRWSGEFAPERELIHIREILLTAAAAFGSALLLTFVMFRLAKAQGLLDVPNERSSHHVPTPRGGGAAIVVTATVVCVGFLASHVLTLGLAMALIVGGVVVAAVGFADDHRSVSAGIRLAIHVGAAGWALWWLGGMPAIQLGSKAVTLGWAGYVLGALIIVWVLNLFNFMDGIDGIAASEAVFVACAGALLTWFGGGSAEVPAAALAFAAACAGFLLWNWPPAKIFMGDVGSGYLGYVIGVLALAASHQNPAGAWMWLILGGAFFVDATVTLIRRVGRGERAYEAHRSHAYQWLARRWQSHERVTVSVTAVNLLWLLPCAFFAVLDPRHAAWIALGALVPLAVLAIVAGAGKRELPAPASESPTTTSPPS